MSRHYATKLIEVKCTCSLQLRWNFCVCPNALLSQFRFHNNKINIFVVFKMQCLVLASWNRLVSYRLITQGIIPCLDLQQMHIDALGVFCSCLLAHSLGSILFFECTKNHCKRFVCMVLQQASWHVLFSYEHLHIGH